MRNHFGRLVRVPTWIAGISICLLAGSGIVAIVRSIPVSYANIPNDGAPSFGNAPSGVEDALADGPRAGLLLEKTAITRGRRASCPECGVVESMRQIEHSGAVIGQGNVEVKFAGDGSVGASGSAIAAGATTAKRYEITIRFRDGSTTVFNEANPRTWRLGSRVMVIKPSRASN